ncbi:MAG TPA: NnrU family protein [Azospirillum sp.]|nr:NnrU family protein [Azospirillum sp.]
MSTLMYLASAILLFASHAVPSWPGVRPALVERLGRPGFIAVHSLLSVVTLTLFVLAYRAADTSGHVFFPADGAAKLAVALMPVAFFLMIARVTTKFGEPQAPKPPAGIYRITRFPGSVGLLLWALLHLQATGDARRVILFATMAAIALFAMFKNDWVLRNSGNPDAAAFRAQTSAVPFAAVLARRQRIVWREIGWARLLGALLVTAAILYAHPLVFGVDPLYWLP